MSPPGEEKRPADESEEPQAAAHRLTGQTADQSNVFESTGATTHYLSSKNLQVRHARQR